MCVYVNVNVYMCMPMCVESRALSQMSPLATLSFSLRIVFLNECGSSPIRLAWMHGE